MPIRVVLADDHQLFRDGVAALLEREHGIEVVAAVADGEQAVAAVRELQPDVLVIDVSMPVLNGVDATSLATVECPHVRVLFLSMHTDQATVRRALVAGAHGYVPKGSNPSELVEAIRALAAGRGFLSPEIAGQVIRQLACTGLASHAEVLTPRERSVLQLLAEGYSTAQTATRLGISVKTVSSHREHVMSKLAIRSIAGLTRHALREGITSLDQ